MESLLSHGKGAAFFPHISQGMLGAHQRLRIDITGYANMWGEYWDDLICTVRTDVLGPASPLSSVSFNPWPSASQISPRCKTVPTELGIGIHLRTFRNFSCGVPRGWAHTEEGRGV